jgi:hypothetical protein
VTQFKGFYVLHTEFNWLPLNCLSKHIFVAVYTVISEREEGTATHLPQIFPHDNQEREIKIFHVAKLDVACVRNVGTR